MRMRLIFLYLFFSMLPFSAIMGQAVGGNSSGSSGSSNAGLGSGQETPEPQPEPQPEPEPEPEPPAPVTSAGGNSDPEPIMASPAPTPVLNSPAPIQSAPPPGPLSQSFDLLINGQSHILTFDQPGENIDGSTQLDIAFYRIYTATERDPNSFISFGDLIGDGQTPISIIPGNTTYYFAICSVTNAGFESKHSNLVPLAVNSP